MWDRIIDGVVVEQSARPRVPGITNPTLWQLNAAYWFEQSKPVPDPVPDGKYVSGWSWQGLQDGLSVYEAVLSDIPVPEYPRPNVTVPMLDGDGAVIGTVRLLADADLNVVAVTDSASPQKPWSEQLAAWQQKRAAAIAERRALRVAARRTVADVDALTPDEATDLAFIYDAWVAGQSVVIGDLRQYAGGLWKCAQAHTTQADWTPDVTPALWVRVAPPDAGPQPWVQPAGAHDAYKTGDQVTHNGHTWQSTVDANVWEPGVYGWTQL